MLDKLWSTFSEETIFLVDTCAKRPDCLGDLPSRVKKGLHTIAHLTPEHYDQGATRLDDLKELMQINDTLILKEVREEFDEKIHMLATGVFEHEQKAKTVGLTPEEEKLLKLTQEHLMLLENYRLRTFGADPREPGFVHEKVPSIMKNSQEYLGLFHTNKKTLLQVLSRKGKKLDERQRYTDAHLVTVAGVLNQLGYEVCVLTTDSDIPDIAVRMFERPKVERIPGTNYQGVIVYDKHKDLSISVFNPERPIPRIHI